MATRTALITGASAGIGLSLARVFARKGHDVILVARSADKLNALAADISAKHKVKATAIALDLMVDGAAQTLCDELARRNLTVDILVNNAGFATYGLFKETDTQKELELLHLNIITLTHLTKLLLPAMLARGDGKILNLGSTGSFAPAPMTAVYCASKAYVLSFSEALATELDGTGVSVTMLAPGPTASDFQSRAAMHDSKLVQSGMMDSDTVAEVGYRALMAGKRVSVPGMRNKVQVALMGLLPRPMLARMALNMQQRVGH